MYALPRWISSSATKKKYSGLRDDVVVGFTLLADNGRHLFLLQASRENLK